MKNNPFEQMQSFMNFENFTKNMQGMPYMDFSSAQNLIKSTSETISLTNQMASESMQSIFKRGSDSLQKNTTELYSTMKTTILADDAGKIGDCQKKYFQSTIDNNVSSAKEIMEMSTKSMIEILDVMQGRVNENMNKVFNTKKK